MALALMPPECLVNVALINGDSKEGPAGKMSPGSVTREEPIWLRWLLDRLRQLVEAGKLVQKEGTKKSD